MHTPPTFVGFRAVRTTDPGKRYILNDVALAGKGTTWVRGSLDLELPLRHVPTYDRASVFEGGEVLNAWLRARPSVLALDARATALSVPDMRGRSLILHVPGMVYRPLVDRLTQTLGRYRVPLPTTLTTRRMNMFGTALRIPEKPTTPSPSAASWTSVHWPHVKRDALSPLTAFRRAALSQIPGHHLALDRPLNASTPDQVSPRSWLTLDGVQWAQGASDTLNDAVIAFAVTLLTMEFPRA